MRSIARHGGTRTSLVELEGAARRAGETTVGVAIAALLAARAATAAVPTTYEVRHDFAIKPGGNVTPTVEVDYYLHCWSRVPNVNDPTRPCPTYDVKPWSAQSPAWHAACKYGRDYAFSRGQISTTKSPNTGTIAITPQSVTIAPTGGGVSDDAYANGCNPDASGEAHVVVVVNPFLFGTEVSGSIDLTGQVCEIEGRAYSFASGAIEVTGGRELRNGQIRWRPKIREQVADALPRIRRQHDPIEYRVTDLNDGNVVEGRLLEIDADYLLDTTGGVTWDLGALNVTARDVEFMIDHSNAALAQQGTLRFSVHGGVVMASSASGVYAGLAPAPGMGVPFLLPISNDITLDYDLGNFGGDPLEVELLLSGAGEFDAGVNMAAPCAADLNGDGAVNSGDLALLLGSWGGAGALGDLNGDGVVNAADLALLLGAWGPCP